MSTPKRGKPGASASTEKPPKNFRWSQNYEDTLLDLLLRETRNGNRPDSSFMATAFRNVINDFNRIHGTKILKKHVQSRIKTMKRHFVDFHGTFNGLSGFSWNEETKMFDAEESVWLQRIEDNPRLAKFRQKTCYNYDKLFELYGNTKATGANASGLKEKSKSLKRGLHFNDARMNNANYMRDFNAAVDSSSFADNEVSKDDCTPTSIPDYGATKKSSGTSRFKQKRKSDLVTVMEDGYKTMAASIDKLSMAIVGTGEQVAAAKFDVAQNSPILEALSALELAEDYMVRCSKALSANPSKAALVVAAPIGIRGKLLQDITGPAA